MLEWLLGQFDFGVYGFKPHSFLCYSINTFWNSLEDFSMLFSLDSLPRSFGSRFSPISYAFRLSLFSTITGMKLSSRYCSWLPFPLSWLLSLSRYGSFFSSLNPRFSLMNSCSAKLLWFDPLVPSSLAFFSLRL